MEVNLLESVCFPYGLWESSTHSLERNSIAILTFSMPIFHYSLPTNKTFKLHKFTTTGKNIFYTADNLYPKPRGGGLHHALFYSANVDALWLMHCSRFHPDALIMKAAQFIFSSLN